MTSAWRNIMAIAAGLALCSASAAQQEYRAAPKLKLESLAPAPATPSPEKSEAPATAEKPAAAPSLPERGRDPEWDRYRIVVDRNIFSRQRGSAKRGPGGSSENGETAAARVEAPPGPPPDPATQVVLIGVSFVGDYATAIFEDRNAGSIIAVQIGEELMGRVAKEITLDGVTFDYKGEALDVPIGRTLLGGEPAAPPEPSATTTTSSSSSATSTTPTSADQKAILERLRQRREQELK